MQARDRETAAWGHLSRSALIPGLMALGWYAMSRQRAYAHAFIPLHSIGAAFVESMASGDLPRSVLGSLGRALMALTLGTVAGVAFGASLGAIRVLDRVIGPLFHAFRQVPHLGLAPLMGLWFGTGEFAKVILVFLAVFYPIVLCVHQGVRAIDRAIPRGGPRALFIERTNLHEGSLSGRPPLCLQRPLASYRVRMDRDDRAARCCSVPATGWAP